MKISIPFLNRLTRLPEPPADWVPDSISRACMKKDAEAGIAPRRAEYYQDEQKHKREYGMEYFEIVRER